MKKVICLLALSLALASCRDQGKTYVQSAPVNNAVVTPTAPSIGDNLNLAALGDLVKNSSSAPEIESKLNSNGSINNLDLDGDGNVDYIRVAEYGTGNNRGFSFNVDMPDGSTQKVADVDLLNSGNGVQMNIRGNQDYYGSNYSHQAHYDMGDVLLMSYLMNNHRPYYSPYRYGHYPRTYASYHPVPRTTYTSRVTRTTTTTTRRPSSTVSSSSANYRPSTSTSSYKPAVAPRVNVATPTTSQKSFSPTSTSASRPVTSGFRSSSTTPTRTTSTSSYRPTSTTYRPTTTTTSRPSTSGFSSSSSSYKPSSSSSYSGSSRPSSSSSSRSSSSFGSSSRSSYSSSSRSSSRR